MNWNSLVSAMEYPHWLMAAGGVLVAVGFIGFVFQKKHSAGRKAANRAVRGAITSKVSTDQKTAAPAAIRTGPSRLDHHCVSWGTLPASESA
jgi:hypothetical protein